MAIILVNLHGKRSQSLSNQMRQGKAMSPAYSVRWWADNDLTPPLIDPVRFLIDRVEWRYAKGLPNLSRGTMTLGDSTSQLPKLVQKVDRGEMKPFDLLFTSPPYFAITNYNYDQWLRLWMLGGADHPVRTGGPWQNKFDSKTKYCRLLEQVFNGCAAVMSRSATVYVRTDAREFTCQTTLDSLQSAFPKKHLDVISRPFTRSTQTALFGDKSPKPGEIDIVLRPMISKRSAARAPRAKLDP